MAAIRKGFLIATAAFLIVNFCFLQSVSSLRYDDYSETDFEDWQPSKFPVVKSQLSAARNDSPSPYETPKNSSPNLKGRNVRVRSRDRNVFVEPKLINDFVDQASSGHFEAENSIRATQPTPSTRARTGHRGTVKQRTSFKTVAADSKIPTNEEPTKSFEHSRKSIVPRNEGDVESFTSEDAERQFARKVDVYGMEFPSRRIQNTPRNRLQLERRISGIVDEGTTIASAVPSSQYGNQIQKSARSFRGRKHYYSSRDESNLAKGQDRGRQRLHASKYSYTESTRIPIGDSDFNQKPYIVLPENQQQQQQHQVYLANEINGKNQVRGGDPFFSRTHQSAFSDGNDYQRKRQPPIEINQVYQNKGQYQAEIQPDRFSKLSLNALQSSNRNTLPFSSSTANYEPTTSKALENVVYQYAQPIDGGQNQFSLHTEAPLPHSSQSASVPIVPNESNQIKPTVFGLGVEQPISQLNTPSSTPHFQTGKFDTGQGKKNRFPEAGGLPFRGRQSFKRAEPTTETPSSVEYHKHRYSPRREGKYESPAKSNAVAENIVDKKTVDAGRQRRRQISSRINQKTGVYTVKPVSVETVTQSSEIPATIFTTFPPRNRMDKESEPSKSGSFRSRSRYQQQPTRTEQAPDGVENISTTRYETSTPSLVKSSPPRAVTRLVGRPTTSTTTTKAPEPKIEEEIDETANYPKEFLEKLKSSKNYVPTPKFNPSALKAHETSSTPRISTTKRNDFDDVEQRQSTTTQKGRYSQSFYRKLAAKTALSSQSAKDKADAQKLEESSKARFPSFKFKSFPSPATTAKAPATVYTTTEPSTSTNEPETTTEERKKFVPKNKVSLEERKHRIELLKEKVRQNATMAERKKLLKESLATEASAHTGSREERDAPFDKVKFSVSSSMSSSSFSSPSTTDHPFGDSSSDDHDAKISHTSKQDLVTLGSEDNVQVVSFENGGTDRIEGAESVSVTMVAPPTSFLSNTAAADSDDSSSTKEPNFSLLNVTLFPSTRHRFSSRINSTTNLTLPQDVELITIPPTPFIIESPEKVVTREPPLNLSVQSLFNTSLNSSLANEKAPQELSVMDLFGSSTRTPDIASITSQQNSGTTTKGTTTAKKKPSGRKKSGKKTSPRNRTTTAKPPRRSAASKSKTNATASTVRSSSQRTADNSNSNNRNNSNINNGTSNDVQPLPLGLADIETIINETAEVVNSNPMSSPKPATAPRSELNALTPETLFGGNRSAEDTTTARAETSSSSESSSSSFNGTSTNSTEAFRVVSNGLRCVGASCENATSQSLHINSDDGLGRRTGTTKSPEILRKLFIFGIFPNNTVRKRPFDESAVLRNNTPYLFRSTTTTTTSTTAQPDYDVFGIYPNNSVVRRRGWKTFDHERYMSPYVIFGIYPNNTIVKKYPNGTVIRDEFMISDNEIKSTKSESNNQIDCPCARNNVTFTTTTTTTSTTTTTEKTVMDAEEQMTTESRSMTTESQPVTTQRNVKNDAETIDLETITESQSDDAREEDEGVVTTEKTETTTSNNGTEEEQEEEEEEKGEQEQEEKEELNKENTTESSTPSSAADIANLNEVEVTEALSTTQLSVKGEEVTTRQLENVEQIDDVSTPRLGLGETTTTFRPSDLNSDGKYFEDINISTTIRSEGDQLEGLVDAERADTSTEPSHSTESSVIGTTESTDRSVLSEIRDSTTMERTERLEEKSTVTEPTDKTTTEFFYFRPTEFSPLKLDINEGLVAKLPSRLSIPSTSKPTTQKPQPKPEKPRANNQNGFGFGLFRNILSNLGLLDQATKKPAAKPTVKPAAKPTVKPAAKPTVKPTPKPAVNPATKSAAPGIPGIPVVTTTQTPLLFNPTEQFGLLRTTTLSNLPKTTTGLLSQSPGESFTIDLLGLQKLETTTQEGSKNTARPPTTTFKIPTTTSNQLPTVTTITPLVDIVKNDDLREVEVLRGLNGNKANNFDSGFLTSTIPNLDQNSIVTNRELGEFRTTTIGTPTIFFGQNANPTVPYALERVTPILGFDSPTERPLTGAGIVSITYDDDLRFESTSANEFEAYQSTTPYYGQKVTVRSTVPPATETTTSIPEFELDIRELGNLITKLTTKNNNNNNNNRASTETTTSIDGLFTTTTTTATERFETTTTTSLNSLLPFSLDYIQSALKGNAIRKRQRRPTTVEVPDEPSSLTNIAYRALSSSNDNRISDILVTTTTNTPSTRPKKTKNASARVKTKKSKNSMSRTSVKAFKNLTEFTSTPSPDSIFIVTPVSKREGGQVVVADDDDNSTYDEAKRSKVKFVTLTPGYVVTTNVRDRNENEILTLSSQHVQKVTKAPANIPDNFLSTVYDELEEKASSPIPEILKNVSNDLDGDGLSVSLAKRIITLALEKAISSTTAQMTRQSTSSTTALPPSSPQQQRVTSPKPQPATKKTTATTKKPVPTTKKQPTSTTEKPKPTVTTTTAKRRTTTTTHRTTISSPTTFPTFFTTTTTEAIVITPKRETGRQIDGTSLRPVQTAERIPGYSSNLENPINKIPAKLISGVDPLEELFEKGTSTNAPKSQKMTDDLNSLLTGLWQETPITTLQPTPKSSTFPADTKSKATKKVKDEKTITLPKKASEALSESDLKLLEGILSQQGLVGGTKDLEEIVQNQIRLAEEVRKASRNLKKKQKTTTTTTTTQRPTPGGLSFLLSLFGSQGPSNPPLRNSRRPQKASQSESFTSPDNKPDPLNESDEDYISADRTTRGELVSAAIDVTKAVSKFMGTVLTSAAQSFQNLVRSLRS